MRPITIIIATIPMMVIPLVYDSCNLTESGSTGFVKRRLLDGRVIFEEHVFNNGTFKTTIL
jgi:hypothetical protein